jgi:hypothetical protein
VRARESPGKDAPFAYIGKTHIPADITVNFNEWYEKKHGAALASGPGCLQARRFLAVDDQPKYTAVYEPENQEVVKSAA